LAVDLKINAGRQGIFIQERAPILITILQVFLFGQVLGYIFIASYIGLRRYILYQCCAVLSRHIFPYVYIHFNIFPEILSQFICIDHDPTQYGFERISATAELASMLEPEAVGELKRRMTDPDSAVRWWATLGILMRGSEVAQGARTELLAALDDSSPYVRIVAAETLARYGSDSDLKYSLTVFAKLGPPDKNGVFVSMATLNALYEIGEKAAPLVSVVKAFPLEYPIPDARFAPYVTRLVKDFTDRFP